MAKKKAQKIGCNHIASDFLWCVYRLKDLEDLEDPKDLKEPKDLKDCQRMVFL